MPQTNEVHAPAVSAASKDPAAQQASGLAGACCANSADSTAAKPGRPEAPLMHVVSHGPAAVAETKSIYDFWSPRRRAVILAVVAVSQFLAPISQNIVLPGLKDMEAAFQTNATAGAAVLACFVFAVGISSLVWGPFCDLLGRKPTYLASTAMYAAATVGCIFSRNIAMLLAFRALQGAALGAYRGAGIGSIADVFIPTRRGLVIGILMTSTLCGPVFGPLMGGFLSQAYGWQAPFVALLIISAGIIIPANLFLVRETHQHKLMKRLDPAAAQAVREGPAILAHPPTCGSPWAPLVAACDARLVLHLMHASVGVACLLSTQAELTGVLAATPYLFKPGLIGVAFIALGGAGMAAAPFGGWLFDNAAKRHAQPMLRLLPNNLASLIGVPSGLLLYGWAAQFKAHPVFVLLGMFLVNFSLCMHFPAFMSYLSIVKQKEAATASSGQNAIAFMIAGVVVLAGSSIAHALGLGWYMTILAAIHLIAASLALGQILLAKARRRQLLPPVPDHAVLGAGG